MTIDAFLGRLKTEAETISFEETMAVIDQHYTFTETAFTNGDEWNDVGKNNGSCKILAFAYLHDLTQVQVLNCFGDYYRKDVLENPDGEDHQNIRNFIKHGWDGVSFECENSPLTLH